jgi:hypothetical protein
MDMNLTKDSIFFVPCYSRSLFLANFQENHTLVLKIITNKSANQENSSLFMNTVEFCRRENEDRKPNKNSSLRKLEFMPRNLD